MSGDEFSLCELGDATFTLQSEWGRRYVREVEVYECLDCGSLVVSKKSHIQWHKQMEAANAT